MKAEEFFQYIIDYIPVGLFPDYNFCHQLGERQAYIEIGHVSISLEDGEINLRSTAFCEEYENIVSENFSVSEIKSAAKAYFFLLKQQKAWTQKLKNLI